MGKKLENLTAAERDIILKKKIIKNKKDELSNEVSGIMDDINVTELSHMPLKVYSIMFHKQLQGDVTQEIVDKFISVSGNRFRGVTIVNDDGSKIIDTPPIYPITGDESLEVLKKFAFADAGMETLNATINGGLNPQGPVDAIAVKSGQDIEKSIQISKKQNMKAWMFVFGYMEEYMKNGNVDISKLKKTAAEDDEDGLEFED